MLELVGCLLCALLKVLMEGIVGFLLFYVGRLTLFLFTFGKIRSESLRYDDEDIFAGGMFLHSTANQKSRKFAEVVVSFEATVWVGVVTVVAMAVAVWVLW